MISSIPTPLGLLTRAGGQVTRAVLGATIAGLFLATSTLTAAGAATSHQHESLAGRWITTVTPNGKPPSEVTIIFHCNKRLTIVGPTDATTGKPAYIGTGDWEVGSGHSLAFDVTHPLPDGNGGWVGVLRGHQEGTYTRHRFTTSGQAYVDKADGTTIGPNPVSMVGTR